MSTVASPRDEPPIVEQDVRPVVATRQSRLPLYLFIASMAVLAVLLFTALDTRRRGIEAPATRPDAADLARFGEPLPTLFVPPAESSGEYLPEYLHPGPAPAAAPLAPGARQDVSEGGSVTFNEPPLRIFQPPPPLTYGPPGPVAATEQPRPSPGGPVLVIDVGDGSTPAGAAAGPGQAGAVAGSRPVSSGRVRSGRLANPSTTIPQGTSIPAVLETALDSTRPGQARAIVSLDVRGFDGSKVLIPRGSRLYGEYQADLQRGQNRALIEWTRLLRPDGIVIAIDSPTADTLGRAGIKGKVNSHFFERFFSAILQSSLDLGVAIASRSVGDGGVVLLPGGLGQASPQTSPEIRPTLRVKQGRSIAVLVARDLDFAAAASGR